MNRRAPTDHPVHDLIARRWSPCGFADRDISPDDLCSLFEAARWAPSSYNEQPWSFIVATRARPGEIDRLVSCLVEGNRGWARTAPVLALTVCRKRFARNGKPNRHAFHDVGLAVAQLTVEATSRGLFVHQMAGIEPDAARRQYSIPDDCEAVTAIAIGTLANPATLPEDIRARDAHASTREPLPSFVFSSGWDQPAEFVSPR